MLWPAAIPHLSSWEPDGMFRSDEKRPDGVRCMGTLQMFGVGCHSGRHTGYFSFARVPPMRLHQQPNRESMSAFRTLTFSFWDLESGVLRGCLANCIHGIEQGSGSPTAEICWLGCLEGVHIRSYREVGYISHVRLYIGPTNRYVIKCRYIKST